MNLLAFLRRGSTHAPSDNDRAQARINEAAEVTRKKWLNALMVDQTRAWMEIGEADTGVIDGIVTMLAIAGFAHVYDTMRSDSPDLRIIRGAISAAEQCKAAGSRVSIADARAFGAASQRATSIIESASVNAIVHAAVTINKMVGVP